jgi:DNA-binding CsgD family transcriptional regulator
MPIYLAVGSQPARYDAPIMTATTVHYQRPRVDAELLGKLMACTTIESLTVVVQTAAERLGFEHWIYGALMPISPTRTEEFVINGYPEEWRQHYLQAHYTFADPTVRYARENAVPSLWDDLATRSALSGQGNRAKTIFNEARAFGLAKGVCIPLHGLGCIFGMMSYASSDPRHPIMESSVHAEATLLATYVHQVASLLISRPHAETLRPLSPRERECLKWAAEGKNSWEIGHLLKSSERTAIFHLTNVTEKLGVMNRQQAVAKDLVLGLLDG